MARPMNTKDADSGTANKRFFALIHTFTKKSGTLHIHSALDESHLHVDKPKGKHYSS